MSRRPILAPAPTAPTAPTAPFAARPPAPESWIKADEMPPANRPPNPYTARLTIDVAPALRARIKIAAFARGLTVAEMVRNLLEHQFPEAGS